MIKRGWDKSILVEGKSEREIKILDEESNSFGFVMVMVNVGFVYVVASSG
ncbi:hypothetical protein [Priestia megaterium]|nr:hypothetical protein [Priestia megaterium]UMZ35175.1 hypothetical protein MGJ28_11020 [Priestia megaterium]